MSAPPDEHVRYNVLFEALPDDVFDTLKDSLKERRYRAGDVIIEEGSEGNELFLIMDGRVRITKRTRDGNEFPLALLHRGDFFGELELIDARSRSATVTAMEDALLFSLDKNAFDRLLETSHTFTIRLLTVLSVRLRALNHYFAAETERKLQDTRLELIKREHLIEATKKLNSTLDLDALLEIIIDIALEMVQGDRGTVYLLDERKNELWARVATGLDGTARVKIHLPIGKGIAGYVGATGDIINIPDAYLDPRFSPDFDKSTGYRTTSILCMPMKNKEGKITGVFQLLNKRSGAFTRADEVLIDGLSIHAALAIENARLYEQERQKILLERDLLAAREVQMSLIPKKLPDIPGYEFAACTIPAKEVGGDLYDFQPISGTHLALCLGDVSGKGLPASLLMANMIAILRSHASHPMSVKEIVQHTNRDLHQFIASDRFVTLFFAVLDTQYHTLTFSNAGQEPPYHVSEGTSLKRLDAGGIPLGMFEEFPYVQDVVNIRPGDAVVICSDGISEAMNGEAVQFGESQLTGIIEGNRDLTAPALLDHIIAALQQHVGAAPQSDDITAVVVRRLPG